MGIKDYLLSYFLLEVGSNHYITIINLLKLFKFYNYNKLNIVEHNF